MDRAAFDRHIRDCYGVEADHPWAGAPGYAVYRHPGSGKWFAVVMDLPGEKLGLPGGSRVDALNLKCDPLLLGSLLDCWWNPPYRIRLRSAHGGYEWVRRGG